MATVAAMQPGWNLGNTLDAIPDETAWGNPMVTQQYVNAVKAAGFNAIRMSHHPMSRAMLDACDRLGAGTLKPEPCGIHRDFYADQVIVAGPRICLIDFDLYCEGDPALDIGNFLGHIQEQSLRSLGDPEALAQHLRELAAVGLGVAAGPDRDVGGQRRHARRDLPHVEVVHLDHVVLGGQRAQQRQHLAGGWPVWPECAMPPGSPAPAVTSAKLPSAPPWNAILTLWVTFRTPGI